MGGRSPERTAFSISDIHSGWWLEGGGGGEKGKGLGLGVLIEMGGKKGEIVINENKQTFFFKWQPS